MSQNLQTVEAPFIVRIIAILVVPFYLGLIDAGGGQFLAYGCCAGIAMATGEFISTPHELRSSLSDFALESTAWMIGFLSDGAIAYWLPHIGRQVVLVLS